MLGPRRRCAALLAVVLLLTASPALAGPIPGGQAGGDPQSSKSGPSLSSAVPGPEWVTSLDGYAIRSNDLIRDASGQVLTTALRNADQVRSLLALDGETGQVVWERPGVDTECTPVASDDGRIFVQAHEDGALVEGDGPNGLFALDSFDGGVIEAATYLPGPGDPELLNCRHGLTLTDGDVLLVAHKRGTINDPFVLHAFNVAGKTIDPMWTIEREARGAENGFHMPVVSGGNDYVWIGWRDADENLMVERLLIADGSSQGLVGGLPGQEFGPGGDASSNPLTVVADGEGLLVETQGETTSLVRIDPAGGGFAGPPQLEITFVIDLEATEPFQGNINSIAVKDGIAYAISGARQVIAFSAVDGTVRYARDMGSEIRGGDKPLVDSFGNVIVAPLNLGGLFSLTPDGQLRWITAPIDEFLGDGVGGRVSTLGPLGPDGVFYLSARGGNAPPQPVIAAIDNGTARLNAEGDVIDGAIELCRYLFADGEARTVVLSRDDQFPDILAGAPLAGDHSCILYTTGGSGQAIDPRTLAEIQRVLPPGGTVRIVGGTAAVSEEVEATLRKEGFDIERIGGSGRTETALFIARIVAEENGTGGEIMLAFANDWPDAVTGGAWAAKTGTPVLLTGTDVLAPEAETAIQEFGSDLVTIAGGTSVISEAVEGSIDATRQEPVETRRVSGPNRFATAVDVAATLWADAAADQAFVLANLEVPNGWALALAASPLSVRLCAPQVGVANGRYPAETSDYLAALGLPVAPGLFVLGDLNVISDDIVTQVETDLGR